MTPRGGERSLSDGGKVARTLSGLVSDVLAALRENRDGLDPLERVCRACTSLLPVDGASISVIESTGQRLPLYASDAVVQRIEDVQFGLGEGPCFEAFETGRPVLVPDLARSLSTQWPVFASEIAAEQIGAIFAFPLRRGAARFGALDMYRRASGWLSEEDLAIALQIVDIATSALLAAMSAGLDRDIGGTRIEETWRPRIAVHQATGMLVAEFAIPAEQALARLRAHAFAAGRALEEVAADVVARRLHPAVIGA